MMRKSLIAIAVVAGLYGCASTKTDEAPAAPEPTSSATPQSATPTPTGTRSSSGQPVGDPRASFAKRSVYYEFDKYDVKAEYRPLVEAHAKYLRDNSSAKMRIEGNADERGSREYNLALGQRRAESVTKMMQLLGVREGQIEAVSFGKEKPRTSGHDEGAWSENRRSDFQYGK
jgi:peptidoglycan-associated lipoprotein